MADNSFWKGGAEDMETVPGKKEKDEVKSEELDMNQMEALQIKTPRPLFEQPTKCEIVDVKFSKLEDDQFDKQGQAYKGFFVTITFKDATVVNSVPFKETYRGGRLYTKETGEVSTYIGANSALGQVKARCLESNMPIGASLKSWVEALKGKMAMLKMDEVTFQNKKYQKNFIVSIL